LEVEVEQVVEPKDKVVKEDILLLTAKNAMVVVVEVVGGQLMVGQVLELGEVAVAIVVPEVIIAQQEEYLGVMVFLEVEVIYVVVVEVEVELALDQMVGAGVELVNIILKLMILLEEVVEEDLLIIMIDALGILNLTEVIQTSLKELEPVEVAKLLQDQEVLEKVVEEVVDGVVAYQEQEEVVEWLKLYTQDLLEHLMVIIGGVTHFIFIMVTHQCILIVNYGTLRRIR
jgi:hypothetical protein